MTDMEFIKAELQKLQKILEARADEYISNDNWNKAKNLLSFATACSGALELLKEQEQILQNMDVSVKMLCQANRKDNGQLVVGYYFCMHHNDDRKHIHHFIIPLEADLSIGTPIEKIQVEIDPNTVHAMLKEQEKKQIREQTEKKQND